MLQGEITFEDLLAEVTPRTATARVLLRQDLLERHKELEAELDAAVERDMRASEGSIDDVPEAVGVAAQIMELQAEIEAAMRPFHFRAIGRKPWRDLLAKHPPTKEQRAADPRLDHNPETFPHAAIAASCTSPVMTAEQVAQFEQICDLSQYSLLWNACLDANAGRGDTPKSLRAGGIALANAELGKQRTTTGSLDQPSLDGAKTT